MSFPEYQDYREYISSPEVRQAFEFLVESSGSLKGITARPYPHGFMKRNFHYFWGDTSPFAFVVNKRWLLFYIRGPAITKRNYDIDELRKLFEGVKTTKTGEINFRIFSIRDAELVMHHIFEVPPIVPKVVYPDEVDKRSGYVEGAVKQVLINQYERDPKARKECIAHFGYVCAICGFDFEKIYGTVGRGFIHVHHLKELSSVGENYKTDPIKDLLPVCPNCHAMLHQKVPAYTPQQLRGNLKPG